MKRESRNQMRSWLACILSLALLVQQCNAEDTSRDERFIGWLGEQHVEHGETRSEKPFWIENISWKPRAFILHNFISSLEAEHIVQQAYPNMQRSRVVGENGSSVLDNYRTSYGTFLNRNHDKVIAAVQRRVAFHTRAPVVNQEDMQVLRYANNQYYKKHMDSLDDDSPRMATMLIYLADPEEGGETSFPDGSVWASKEIEAKYSKGVSDCAKGHVSFWPRKGDALLFWSITPDNAMEDPASMHEGCPVTKGSKWTATVWVHSKPFRPKDFHEDAPDVAEQKVDPGECRDTEDSSTCAKWAAAGECKKNMAYMIGEGGEPGHCMATCKACEVCDEGDQDCMDRNRRKLGYLVFDPEELQYVRPY